MKIWVANKEMDVTTVAVETTKDVSSHLDSTGEDAIWTYVDVKRLQKSNEPESNPSDVYFLSDIVAKAEPEQPFTCLRDVIKGIEPTCLSNLGLVCFYLHGKAWGVRSCHKEDFTTRDWYFLEQPDKASRILYDLVEIKGLAQPGDRIKGNYPNSSTWVKRGNGRFLRYPDLSRELWVGKVEAESKWFFVHRQGWCPHYGKRMEDK